MSRWLRGFIIAIVAALVGSITHTHLHGQSRKRSKTPTQQRQTARNRPSDSELKRLESFRKMVRQGLAPVNRLGGDVDPTSRVVGDSDSSTRTWMAADPNATGEVQKFQAGFADRFRRLDPEPVSRTIHFAWIPKRDDVRQVGWTGVVLAVQPRADGISFVRVRMRPRFNAGGYKVMFYDFVDEVYAYSNATIALIASDAAVAKPDLQRFTLFH